jgi:hypothetical protein
VNPKTFVTQTIIAFFAFLYLQSILILINKIKKNRRYKKTVEALGWKAEFVHHPLVARFIKR